MTGLLIFAALAAAVTVWYLARAVRSATAPPGQERDDGLVQLRDRLLAQLRELDVEVGDGNVDPNAAADERRRLEAELAQVLKDLDAFDPPLPPGEGMEVGENARRGPSQPSPYPSPGQDGSLKRWVIVALAVIVPLASAGLYFGKNSVLLAQLDQVRAFAGADLPPEVMDMVARLERRLVEQPGDPQGWMMLGRSYAALGRPGEAQRAYARAYQIAPDDSEIIAAYAGFLMSIDPVRPSAEAAALLRKLHGIDPQHPAALWGLGLVAFHAEEFRQARTYWEQLLEQLPPDSEIESQVRQAVEAARAQTERLTK